MSKSLKMLEKVTELDTASKCNWCPGCGDFGILVALKQALFELKLEERSKEIAAFRGEYVKAEFGNQIRSYVLHPYQMVKDHRNNFETSNTGAVLDGHLDDFMEAYLRTNLR